MIIDMGAARKEDIAWSLNPLPSELFEKSKPMKGETNQILISQIKNIKKKNFLPSVLEGGR
jgi:hypothetical protein